MRSSIGNPAMAWVQLGIFHFHDDRCHGNGRQAPGLVSVTVLVSQPPPLPRNASMADGSRCDGTGRIAQKLARSVCVVTFLMAAGRNVCIWWVLLCMDVWVKDISDLITEILETIWGLATYKICHTTINPQRRKLRLIVVGGRERESASERES